MIISAELDGGDICCFDQQYIDQLMIEDCVQSNKVNRSRYLRVFLSLRCRRRIGKQPGWYKYIGRYGRILRYLCP
jgi:hypothetical protein